METKLHRLGKMGWFIAPISIVMLSGCHTKTHRQSEDIELEPVAFSDAQWTGLAVSKEGRLFVNYPRSSANVPVSVAELKNGDPIPYPDNPMNNWKPGKDLALPVHRSLIGESGSFELAPPVPTAEPYLGAV